MTISNLETKNIFVELLDDDAETVHGGGISINAEGLDFFVNGLNLNTDNLRLLIDAAFLHIDKLKLTL